MLLKPEVQKVEWGELIVFLNKKFDKGSFIEAGVFSCEPQKSLPLHTHEGGDEYCWVFEGTAIFLIDKKEYEVKAGELIKIPMNLEHRSYPQGKAPFKSFFVVSP